MRVFFSKLIKWTSYPQNFVLFLARVVLAFGFVHPIAVKMNDMDGTIRSFAEAGIIYPHFCAYLVFGLEIIGIVLLIFGLFTRIISLLLAGVMLTAIVLVHAQNGFSVAQNGFEIPLYYLIFLLVFISFGAGKYSLDALFFEGEY